ncbi:MAG: T9SS type A sorting domain-containing protein [Prolixibacteraceae bacterium]|nr:T9SS type A sorting domain-containing protein [Prolixibacteraceae bacterium]
MIGKKIRITLPFMMFFIASFITNTEAQEIQLTINPEERFNTFTGFGASLAFYENWLTAHPNKKQIYEAVFGELSLDILRVRNAHGYDAGMITRVKEFVNASETVQGRPIPFLSTSWGPPAYLKSNNDRSNGGSLKYTIVNGKVEFDYKGFANWWNESLDAYSAAGISPTYISIQNEPDYTATWESCRLEPTEKITNTDTIAGYNIALDVVYNKLQERDNQPLFLGPESIGIGYNAVRNYINRLDKSKLDVVAHHLYHGINVDNPWDNSTIYITGLIAEEIPHFMSEYSGNDWFPMSGLIYKTLADENACAYFYWDLIWDNGGLVSLEFPWDRSRWTTAGGYIKTKKFYTFKQFSGFIHPGWQRLDLSFEDEDLKAVSFGNAESDSISLVLINRSSTKNKTVKIGIEGFNYNHTEAYITSKTQDCEYIGGVSDSVITLPPYSVTTILFTHIYHNAAEQFSNTCHVYPNPFNKELIINGNSGKKWHLYSLDGHVVKTGTTNIVDGSNLKPGAYLLKTGSQVFSVLKKEIH